MTSDNFCINIHVPIAPYHHSNGLVASGWAYQQSPEFEPENFSLNKQLTSMHSEGRKRAITAKIIETEQKLRQSHANQRMNEENRAVNNIKCNPKYFFSYCKRYSKISPLKNNEDSVSTNPKTTCQLVLQQYSSVFSAPHPHNIINNSIELSDDKHQAQLTDIIITPEDIERATQELQPNSAAGPDGGPAILLLKCSKTLVQPLCKLWRCSLDTGVIPEHLKNSYRVPNIQRRRQESIKKL